MKRVLLIAIALLMLYAPAGAAITAVGSATSGTGVVIVTPTAGDLLVATVRNVGQPANQVLVFDSSGVNLWQRAASCSNGKVDDDEIWYSVAVKGATYSISLVNSATGAANLPGTVTEWAGAGNLTVVGACFTGTATTTVRGSPIVLPSPANDTNMIIQDWASADASSTQSSRTCVSCTTTPTTWTSIAAATAGPSGESAYMILTAAGSAQYRITTASAVTFAAANAAFAAAAPVASATPTASPTPLPTTTATATGTATSTPAPTSTPTAAPTAVTSRINLQGSSGAPLSVTACASGTSILLTGKRHRANWSLMPEGGDIRCMTGTADNGGPNIAPSATVGFLFKSNVLVPENTIPTGSSAAELRLDCCGVSGAVPVSTWEE